MPYADLEGTSLYYEERGEGPPLVFLHGAGTNHMSWFQQVPEFRDRYRCITIDQRGFGRSSDKTGESSARFADDLAGLLDELGEDRAFLVAQSMGGWTALDFAIRHPGRARAIVMGDTVGGAKWLELDALREQHVAPSLGPPEVPVEVSGLGEPFREANPSMMFLYAQMSSLNPEGAIARFLETQPVASREQVAALEVPALFIVGSLDPLIPPPIVRAVHEEWPGSEYLEVPACGHSVYFEDPATFNDAVAGFLAKHA